MPSTAFIRESNQTPATAGRALLYLLFTPHFVQSYNLPEVPEEQEPMLLPSVQSHLLTFLSSDPGAKINKLIAAQALSVPGMAQGLGQLLGWQACVHTSLGPGAPHTAASSSGFSTNPQPLTPKLHKAEEIPNTLFL